MNMKKNKTVVIIQRIITWAATIVFLFPFYISILMAFKSKKESVKDLLAFPTSIHWENFADAMKKANILESMKNSIILTVGAVVLTLIVASMAGYAIGRQYHKKTFRLYETLLMAAMMIPFQTLMIPIYKMYKSMNLLNSIPGAIIMIGACNMPFAVMLFIGFVRTIPIELEEAAMLEGCSKAKIFFKIIFPLLKPITVTIAVLDSLWTWNEFNVSLLLLQKKAVKTIPIQQYVFFGEHSSNYNMAFAAAVISMIPIVIFFIVAQKHIVAGMTAGAVKG